MLVKYKRLYMYFKIWLLPLPWKQIFTKAEHNQRNKDLICIGILLMWLKTYLYKCAYCYINCAALSVTKNNTIDQFHILQSGLKSCKAISLCCNQHTEHWNIALMFCVRNWCVTVVTNRVSLFWLQYSCISVNDLSYFPIYYHSSVLHNCHGIYQCQDISFVS